MWEIVDFNENHYSTRQKIGEPGSKSIRNIFPVHSVPSKRPESPHGAKDFFFGRNSSFSVFRHIGSLLVFQFFRPNFCAHSKLPATTLRVCTAMSRTCSWAEPKGPWEGNPWEHKGSIGGSIGRKFKKLDFRPKKNILLHMAIQGVLTWQDGAEKYCGSIWTPALQFSVLPNSGFH